MEWFFVTRRKFSWQSCLVCGLLALLLASVVLYGGMAIADATKETRASEQAFVEDSIIRWNASLPAFEAIRFSVKTQGTPAAVELSKNETYDYSIRGWPTVVYRHLKYYAQVSMYQDVSTLWNSTSEELPGVYNLTTNVTLSFRRNTDYSEASTSLQSIGVFRKAFARLNQKMCGMHNSGVWDMRTQACYQFFVVTDICIVFNTSSHDFAGPCSGSYETWARYYSDSLDFPENFTIVSGVTVRAVTDPILVDSTLKAVSSSHVEKIIVGALLIVIGCLFFLVPVVYFWQMFRGQSEQLLQKRNIELGQPREGYIPRY